MLFFFIDDIIDYSMEQLDYLLKIDNVIIPNENALLSELMKYYNHNIINSSSIIYIINIIFYCINI